MEEEIRAALHAELQSDDLKKLPEDFFIRLKGYLAQLREDHNRNSSHELKLLFQAKEKQVRRMQETLITARLLKMFSLLLQENVIETLPDIYRLLTKEEKKLFQEVMASVNSFRTSIITVDIQKDIAYKEARTTDVHENHRTLTEKRLVLVEILEYMPKYLDDEGCTRGPHEPGDLISISEEIAVKILTSKGKARIVETASN